MSMKKMKKILCLVLALLVLSMSSVFAYTYTPSSEPTSPSVYMYSLTSDSLVYAKNANEKKDPAYLAQIMTCIVAAENVNGWEEPVTAPAYIYDELYLKGLPTADIRMGETVTVKDLLYAMIVQSSCEAANIIADYVGKGSIPTFIEMMNNKAKELGCSNTYFTTPHGALSDEDYTTAEDLFKIYRHALTLPGFSELFSALRYTIPANAVNGTERILTTGSVLIDIYNGGTYYYKYATTAKASASSKTGRNLVSTAEKNDFSYMIITLEAPLDQVDGKYRNFVDHQFLYNWAFDELKVTKILESETSIAEIKVTLSEDKDYVLLYPEKDFSFLLPEGVSADSIQTIKNLPESIKAPVKKGDVVGSMTLKLANEELATVNLIAGSDLSAAPTMKAFDIVGQILTSPWFLGIVGVFVVGIVALIIYARVHHVNKKRYKRVRHRRRF